SDQVTKEFADRADKMLLFLAKHLKVLRKLPRAHVKILGVVMLTCLKGGRHAAAARLWLRMMMRSLAAPRLVFTYHLQAAVVLRDRLGRIGRHQGRNLVGAGRSTVRRPSHGVRHLVAVEGPNKRSAEPG